LRQQVALFKKLLGDDGGSVKIQKENGRFQEADVSVFYGSEEVERIVRQE
jgi:hypothetical protein